MKKTVYTKAGQVGLVEVERPQIEAPDDVILRIVHTCVSGSDLWSYRNPDIEAGHQNSGHEAIGIVEEIGEAIDNGQNQETLSSHLSPMVVGGDACRAGYDGTQTVISAPTGLMGCKRSTCASNTPTGPLSKSRATIRLSEAMLKSFLTLADVMPTGYHAARSRREAWVTK